MDKSLTTIVFIILSTCFVNGQVNWNEYNEPDGNYLRWYVLPFLDIGYSENQFQEYDLKLDVSLGSIFQYNYIKELSILSFYTQLDPNFVSDKKLEDFISVNQFSRLSYTKYLTERRGLFVEFAPLINYTYKTSNSDKLTGNVNANFFLGKGRLENVSSVYHSMRIYNQYNDMGNSVASASQENLFELAKTIRELSYNTKLDSRMRRIDNQAHFLETVNNLGFEIDDYYAISNVIDAYRYESPNTLSHGTLFRIGLEANDITGSFDPRIVADVFLNRAINEKWHISNSFNADYYTDDNEIRLMINTTLHYLPSQRTIIKFNFNPAYSTFFADRFDLNSRNSLQYFISPKMSLTGYLDLLFNNVFKDFYSNQVRLRFGFLYFIK